MPDSRKNCGHRDTGWNTRKGGFRAHRRHVDRPGHPPSARCGLPLIGLLVCVVVAIALFLAGLTLVVAGVVKAVDTVAGVEGGAVGGVPSKP